MENTHTKAPTRARSPYIECLGRYGLPEQRAWLPGVPATDGRTSTPLGCVKDVKLKRQQRQRLRATGAQRSSYTEARLTTQRKAAAFSFEKKALRTFYSPTSRASVVHEAASSGSKRAGPALVTKIASRHDYGEGSAARASSSPRRRTD
ncbi:hypothetical protein MRX96_048065 [Rhipicephalus microplus]